MPTPRRVSFHLDASSEVTRAQLDARGMTLEEGAQGRVCFPVTPRSDPSMPQSPAWARGETGRPMQQACGHSVQEEDGDGTCRLCALATLGYGAFAAQFPAHTPPAFPALPPRVQAGWAAAAAVIRQRVMEEGKP